MPLHDHNYNPLEDPNAYTVTLQVGDNDLEILTSALTASAARSFASGYIKGVVRIMGSMPKLWKVKVMNRGHDLLDNSEDTWPSWAGFTAGAVT